MNCFLREFAFLRIQCEWDRRGYWFLHLMTKMRFIWASDQSLSYHRRSIIGLEGAFADFPSLCRQRQQRCTTLSWRGGAA